MEFPEAVGELANQLLVWIGFGTLVGLLAKAIMPGKDPGGALTTVMMGILGAIFGAGVLAYYSENLRVSPLSPLGFVVSTAGAFGLLSLSRLMTGKWQGNRWLWNRPVRGRRRVSIVQQDE